MVSVNGTSGVNSDYTIKKRNQETNVQTADNNTSIFTVSNPDTKAVSNTSETKNVDKTSQESIQNFKNTYKKELEGFRSLGVDISYGNNYTCNLSHNGHAATINFKDSQTAKFEGDFSYFSELLQASVPEEKQSVESQKNLTEFQEAKGDPVVGNIKTVSITVNGKSISVNEYTTKSGNKYYLDSEGNQVTPDS